MGESEQKNSKKDDDKDRNDPSSKNTVIKSTYIRSFITKKLGETFDSEAGKQIGRGIIGTIIVEALL